VLVLVNFQDENYNVTIGQDCIYKMETVSDYPGSGWFLDVRKEVS